MDNLRFCLASEGISLVGVTLGTTIGVLFVLIGAMTLADLGGFGHWLWGRNFNWFWNERISYQRWRWLFGLPWLAFGLLIVGVSVVERHYVQGVGRLISVTHAGTEHLSRYHPTSWPDSE